MTEQLPASAGNEAQQSAVANSIDSIIDNAVIEGNKVDDASPNETTPEIPKELTPAEELDKLRRAKARDDRRIGKITAQKYQHQKEAEDLRIQLSKYQTPQQQGGELSAAKTGIPTKLNQNSFNNYAEFIEARAEEIADYKIDKKLAEYSGKQKETQQTAQEQAWESQRSTVVDKMAEEFAKEAPELPTLFEEYADVLRDYPKELRHALLAADNPPLAFYNLAKDGKLEDLASMSLVDAKVEIRLAQMKQLEKPKTKAPTPLPASRGSVPSGKSLDQMSGAELLKALNL